MCRFLYFVRLFVDVPHAAYTCFDHTTTSIASFSSLSGPSATARLTAYMPTPPWFLRAVNASLSGREPATPFTPQPGEEADEWKVERLDPETGT